MTSIGSEQGTLPALQGAAYSKNNITPEEDEHNSFLRALPQLVKLRIPCPCSKSGLVSLQKRNLLKDPQELIIRSCKGGEDGFQTWIDYMKHARPLKDFAHQCIRHYIQEQQIGSTGRDRDQVHESKKNAKTNLPGPRSGSVATRTLQLSDTMTRTVTLDSTGDLAKSSEEKTECLPPVFRTIELQIETRRSLTSELQHDPLLIEVAGLDLRDGSNRAKLLKALTAVLPEARVISPNNIYPKLNPATGEFLGSVALEFAKTEKGRILWYLVSLSFPSVMIDPDDEAALSAYPDLASRVQWRRACLS